MNRTPDFHEGLNNPSPVGRVLILGYYDGATNGVFQLGEAGAVYRFDECEEAYNPDGVDERTYELRQLPADALDRLAAVIGEYIAPAWPNWAPVWTFAAPEIEAAVNRQVDAVLALAGPPEWRVTTGDTIRFGTVTAHPIAQSAAI